jgi:hypothetical protein
MAHYLKRCVPFGLVFAGSVLIAFANTRLGDYSFDGGPAVHALLHGDFAAYFAAPAIMGPFSTLVQVPFAALGGSQLTQYQWACVPCLVATGLLGLYLAELAGRRGASPVYRATIATLCLVNPLTCAALWGGHPEELLTGALAVGAVAVASEGHNRRAALLLGLALASKQWAVIAILPTLMALPNRRGRAALGAFALALALTLPSFIAAPSVFSSVQTHAATTSRVVDPWNVWYLFAPVVEHRLSFGSTRVTAHVHEASPLVTAITHPLIVLLAFVVPLALIGRRRRFGVSGADAMALLALLALLRCALDPVGNLYYHEPLLLALIGWDALARPRTLPLRGLLCAAVAALFWKWPVELTVSQLSVFSAAYTAVAVASAIVIGASLFGRSRRRSGIEYPLLGGIPSSVEPVS